MHELRPRRVDRRTEVQGAGASTIVHMWALLAVADAVAASPPTLPADTAAPLSATRAVISPLPVCEPLERTATPGGGPRVVVVESLWVHHDTTHDRLLLTAITGVTWRLLPTASETRVNDATGLLGAVPR
jgi:hypothetical protein